MGMKQNPGYTELSGRALLDWGLKSGLWRKSGDYKACSDDPARYFGIHDLDGDTLIQMIQAVIPLQKRNFVAMEVKKNLLLEERKGMLAKFDGEDFKKVAMVVMGEPPKEFKAKVHAAMLDEKKKKAVEVVKKEREDREWKRKQEAEEAEWKKKKEAEEAEWKKQEEEKKKAAEGEDGDKEKKEGDDA